MNQKSRKNLSRNLNGNMILLRAEGEDDNRQVQLSFSSEEPYQRWFGPEILSHEEGAADLSRLQDIGVLLWQHRPDAPIQPERRRSLECAAGLLDCAAGIGSCSGSAGQLCR
nr:MAG TPA: major capsid protein [Caudoviricetes sp.]